MAKESDMKSLLDWVTEEGGSIHPDVVIGKDNTFGWTLQVRKDSHGLPPGSVAVSCPLSTTISYHDAMEESSDPFPNLFLSSIDYGTISAFFLVKQQLLGSRSRWHPYLQTLPPPSSVDELGSPANFNDEDLVWLKGTNLETSYLEYKKVWQRDWEKGIMMLERAKWPQGEDYTWDLYRWAIFIISSRAFRSTLSFPCLNSDSKSRPEVAVLIPLLDLLNHNPFAKTQWQPTSADPPVEFLVNLLIQEPLQPGLQIWNNYGSKSNDELLLSYGFCIPNNPFDQVALRVSFPAGSPIAEAKEKQASLREPHRPPPPSEVYYIRGRTHPHRYKDSPTELIAFPRPLLDSLSIIFASDEELEDHLRITADRCYIEPSPTTNPISPSPDVLIELQNWLTRLFEKIKEFSPSLPPEPKNQKQQNASIYRSSQLDILATGILMLECAMRERTEGSGEFDVSDMSDLFENFPEEMSEKNRRWIKKIFAS
ncbi:MAG: hypothetical protein M1834_003107 [Cirrosporium novae-zelandiae]|nr:MAG: hypothetical protein M1834_003107 [Cirrosporium novae-zelandiae]